MARPSRAAILQDLWVTVGLGLLLAGVLVPMSLADGVPSGRTLLHHCARAATPRLDGGWLLSAGCTLFVAVAGGRALMALWRVAGAERRRRRLAYELRQIDGQQVRVVAGPVAAFCGGLVRPRIYVSASAIALLSSAELRAVVAHEQCHARRREPLRLVGRRVLRELLFFVPVLRPIDARLRVVGELHADDGAVRHAAGDRRPIASALLRFDASASGCAVLPERVDQLCGVPSTWRPPRASTLRSIAQLALVASAGVALIAVADQAQLVTLQSCSMVTLGLGAIASLIVLLRCPGPAATPRFGRADVGRRSRAPGAGGGGSLG